MFIKLDQGEAFISRLATFVALTAEDVAALRSVFSHTRLRDFPAKANVTFDREPLNGRAILDRGFAYRCRDSIDGNRAILSFIVPGEIVDLFGRTPRDRMFEVIAPVDSSFMMLSSGDYGLLVERQNIAAAIRKWKNEELRARDDQIVALAHYRADAKVAVMLLDLLNRLRAANQAHGDSFVLPLTQEELGSALGLSVVHVNRVLGRLKRTKLITTDRHRITVLDAAHLAKLAQQV